MIALRPMGQDMEQRAGMPAARIGTGLVRPGMTPARPPMTQPMMQPARPATPGGAVPPMTRPTLPPGAVPTGLSVAAQPIPAAAPAPAAPPPTAPAPSPTPTAPPVAAPAGAALTPINPNADLRSQTITPGADPRLTGAQAATDAAAHELSTGPNRTELAKQTLADFDAANAKGLSQRFLNVGQQAAKFGRIGHGENETAVKDLQLQYEGERGRLANQLASDVAGGDIADRFQRVSTLGGLEGSIAGQGAAARDELRTERGYETGAANDATDRAIQERQLEETLTNSAFGRDVTKAQFGGDLGRLQGALGAEHNAAAAGAAGDIGALLQAYTASKVPRPGVPVPSGTAPVGAPAGVNIDDLLRSLHLPGGAIG